MHNVNNIIFNTFGKKRHFIVSSQFNLSIRKMSNKCKVAILQFTATNNKEQNLNSVSKLIKDAAEKQAKVVFLPEACDYIGISKDETKQLAEPLNGPLMQQYKKIAQSHNVWLSIGGVHEKLDENTRFNSHIIIDDSGEVKSIYRKIHLFDVAIPEKNVYLRESDLNIGGSHIDQPVSTPAGAVGLAICYDLRFPEISTIQTKLGAQILTYPSAFTHKTGEAHWETLLRARAIENQCYVIAAAQYGKHNAKRISHGQSMIIDPWGQIVASLPKYNPEVETNESVAVAEIDLDFLNKVRTEMPCFQHRRHDVYDLSPVNMNMTVWNNNDSFKFADKVIKGSTVFYRSKHSYAFTNIRCVVPGHVLVSTIRVAPRLVDLSQDEIADLFQTVVRIQRAMETDQKTISTTVCVQDGPLAGQTVPHVHVHILPRTKGDFARNDDIYMHLAKHDSVENQNPFRKEEEMIEEAKKLRNYFL